MEKMEIQVNNSVSDVLETKVKYPPSNNGIISLCELTKLWRVQVSILYTENTSSLGLDLNLLTQKAVFLHLTNTNMLVSLT